MSSLMRALLAIKFSVILLACTSDREERNIQTAREVFDAFNRHDWNAMANLYAENALFLDPAFGKEYVTKSRRETVEKYAGMEKMFPNIRDSIVGVYPSGNTVTVEFISTGSMSDSISFRLPIISVLTFQDGQVIKDATYYDL